MIDGEVIISQKELPATILKYFSEVQQSYLDEFDFHKIERREANIDFITAYYANEIMAVWFKVHDANDNEWRSFSENNLIHVIKSDIKERKRLYGQGNS